MQRFNLTQKVLNKARILLLNPPTAAVSTEVLLNLAYLAASLRKVGHEVKIIDATAPYKSIKAEEIEKIIMDFQPHFIGVTLTITYIPQTYMYLKELCKTGIPIVAGGPHANCLPEEVLENCADIVVIGEGEETIVELAEYFIGTRNLESIAGLCFKDKNSKTFYTPPRRLIEDLDSLPFPDFGDFPIKNYTGSEDVDSNPIFWSLFTSRGCPFDCIFCSSHNVFGRTIRMRSARNVLEEIKGLVNRFGVRKITFQDDEILCSKKRFLELCFLILNSGLKINMSIRTRIDSIDKEILLKGKSAGLTRISFGIESWNDDSLVKINKKYNVKKICENFKDIEETRFPFVSFNNILGFPWETRLHLQRSLQEISRIPASIPYFTSVVTPVPYPKTKLYSIYHEQFGFTNWWLDPEKNYSLIRIGRKPFFMHFAVNMEPLYKTDIYWKYTGEMRKYINSFSWKLFKMFIRKHFTFYNYAVIFILCKISYSLWKVSPGLEEAIFTVIPVSGILRLKDNINYVSKN